MIDRLIDVVLVYIIVFLINIIILELILLSDMKEKDIAKVIQKDFESLGYVEVIPRKDINKWEKLNTHLRTKKPFTKFKEI